MIENGVPVMRAIFHRLIVVVLLAFVAYLSGSVTAQDKIPDAPAAAFIAYHCNFIKDTNSAQIQAVLMGSDGMPIPREAYTIQAAVVETGAALPASSVEINVLPTRPPLQMILVLDITDTVPIEQIVSAVTGELAPQLLVEDQVALITFSAEIAPRTQFYTDKIRLANEHMIDLLTLDGDNRLYDAIFEAVANFPFNAGMRQVVLVLTDSNRRDTEQVSLNQIIERAQRSRIQVFAIGFYSRDRPDENELRTLTNASGGYSWFYTEINNTRASIEAAVREYLQNLIVTLNSEIQITIDLSGQKPGANGFITFDLTLDPTNEVALTSQITCPIETLQHSIRFVDDINGTTIRGLVDLGVMVESDLSPDEIRVVFRVNNEIVQNSDSQVYTFDATARQPGYYEIGAQLVDRNNNVLATVPLAIRLYVQQTVDIEVNTADLTALTGEITFTINTDPQFQLPAAQFYISPVENREQEFTFGSGLASFGADGRAVLTIPNIWDAVRALYPDVSADSRFQIRAVVPGISTGDAPLATSNELVIGVVPPPAVSSPVTIIAPPEFDRTVPFAAIAFFGVLNVLLYRAVGRSRIKRMIRFPDNEELSSQLMTITVRRDGMKQAHTLTKKTVTIGRGSANDIKLGEDPNISRQHGVVMWRKGAWYYSNRKARASARINGKRYRGYVFYKLTPVTEIEIGNALLIFHSNAQQDVSEFIKTNL